MSHDTATLAAIEAYCAACDKFWQLLKEMAREPTNYMAHDKADDDSCLRRLIAIRDEMEDRAKLLDVDGVPAVVDETIRRRKRQLANGS